MILYYMYMYLYLYEFHYDSLKPKIFIHPTSINKHEFHSFHSIKKFAILFLTIRLKYQVVYNVCHHKLISGNVMYWLLSSMNRTFGYLWKLQKNKNGRVKIDHHRQVIIERRFHFTYYMYTKLVWIALEDFK